MVFTNNNVVLAYLQLALYQYLMTLKHHIFYYAIGTTLFYTTYNRQI